MKYFIYGGEPYLLHQRKFQIQSDAIKANAECEFLSANEIDLTNLKTILSPSLFSEKKYLFIDHLENAKPKDIQSLSEVTASIPSDITLVFIWNDKLKKAELSSSPLKEITKGVKIYEENTPSEGQLIDWITREVQKYGKKITPDATKLLLSEIPNDMWTISFEIEKCVSYIGQKTTIECEDIKKNLFQKSAGSIFEFAKAIETKNKKKALEIFEKLSKGKLEPLVILDRVYKTLLRIYQVKLLLERGIDKGEILRKAGLHPYYDSKFFEHIKNFTDKEISDCFKLISKCNLNLKRVETYPEKQLLITDLLLRIFYEKT